MKFHSDLFGWEYVWRNFADDKGGTVITETAAEDSAFVSMTVAISVGTTGKTARLLIAPASHHGKKSSGIKIVAPFEALDDFVFSIFPETFAQQLVKAVGAQDIKIQDQLFDSKFMIQGNQPHRVAELFADVNLRELVLLQPPSRLGIETKTAKAEDGTALPAKYHAVVYQYDGHVDKLHQLETALSVVTAVLEHMLIPYAGNQAKAYGDNRLGGDASEADGALSQSKRLRSPLLDR
ncbi:MAG: hypothetical protein KGS72_12605 [Cyanobacteria bacterium REEB67]|nr:hypothetical protein [Cyanobacteria bacterium REEB67]